MQDLEERGQRAGCDAQSDEDIVKGGAPLLDFDVEVDCEGGVLDGWRDEERGVFIKHSNHSKEET